MPTLLIRLAGPMQSWGTSSRFDRRDTGKEPSKSGVIGLLSAAMGIGRENWVDLEPLAALSMGIRHDRPGILKQDYQTASNIISADHSKLHETAVTKREYLADAVFLVALESVEDFILKKIHAALRNPVWPLFLGRKSYLPSEPVWIESGLRNVSMREALEHFPWIAHKRRNEKLPEKLLISFESLDGSGVLKMDQPLSSFAMRRFGGRFVRSEWVPFPQEVAHVPE